MEVFDFRVIPKVQEFFKNHLPEPIEAFKPYYRRFHYDPAGDARFNMGIVDDSVEELKANGVTKALIMATCSDDNVLTYEAMKKFPEFFYGLATVHCSRGITRAFKGLEKAYDEYGFSGVGLNPYLENIVASDRKYYPLYALSESRGKFVQIHSSFHYNPYTSLGIGDPMHIDQIALDFPDLKIIIGHAGRGFGSLAAWIADKHENVYLDLTAMMPQYVDKELMHMANTLLRKKIIYGSSNPLFNWDIWKTWLPFIKEENQKLFFHDNAMRVLGLLEEKKKAWNEK